MSTGRDSYLCCTVCGRESKTNFGWSLRMGWPKCCGYTMRLERTDADIEGAMDDVFAGAQAQIRREYKGEW